MDREQMGKLLSDAFDAVEGDDVPWRSMDEDDRERLRKVAERFLALRDAGNAAFPRYARVSLLGHRGLGLCRVTQERVGEATMLRCESVDAVTWTTPASVYALTEETDGEEHLRVLRELREGNARRKAEAAEAAQRQRSAAVVTLIDDVEHHRVGVRADDPDLLQLTHDMRETIEKAGGNYHGCHALTDAEDRAVGFVVDRLGANTVESMLRAVGFGLFVVRAPDAPDELDMDIPF